MTEEKRLEQELRENVVRLKRENKLKDLTIDLISHDLINQLMVIEGMADSLEGNIREVEETQRIKRSSAKMEAILEDLRVFSRLESGEAVRFR